MSPYIKQHVDDKNRKKNAKNMRVKSVTILRVIKLFTKNILTRRNTKTP
jgi:hypothetical protein